MIAVKAVGICGSDVHGFTGASGRRRPPIVMGHEFSGQVVQVGEGATRFRVGDRVVAQPLYTCGRCRNCRVGLANICLNRGGLGMTLNGAYAERVVVPAQMLFPLPGEVSWRQGVMIEPLAVALRAANLSPVALGDSVAVIGAGTIGLLTLAALKMKGTGKLIISDLSAHRLEVAQAMGADVVINGTVEDAVEVVLRETDGIGAPVVVEAVGTTLTVQQSVSMVCPGGHVIWLGNAQPEVELLMQQVVTREVTIRGAYGFNEEFERAIQIISQRRLDVSPLIERVAPLEEGPSIVEALAKGALDIVKAILEPER